MAKLTIDRDWALKKMADIASERERIQRKKDEISPQESAFLQAVNAAKTQLMEEVFAHEVDPD